jgi:hypothetical protein
VVGEDRGHEGEIWNPLIATATTAEFRVPRDGDILLPVANQGHPEGFLP